MGIKIVIISGTATENCCHATARDAMFRNYQVAFLSDATGTFDYPDVGQGALSGADVHRATLTIFAFSTADVMTVDEFKARVVGANVAPGEQGGVTGRESGSDPDFAEQNPGIARTRPRNNEDVARLTAASPLGAGRGDGTPSRSRLRLDASTRRGARCVDNID